MSRLLAYTAIIMLWHNPLLLWHDLGFQLSFLATIGLVGLSEPLTKKLTVVPDVLGMRVNLATTLGAILMTEPLLLWRFGRLSLVAPFVNISVLPLIPMAMGIGSLSLLGLIWAPIGAVFVPMTDALLRVVLGLISFGASLPQAMIYLPYIGTTLISCLCCVIIWHLLHHHETETFPA
jgi:competence protein ComEC